MSLFHGLKRRTRQLLGMRLHPPRQLFASEDIAHISETYYAGNLDGGWDRWRDTHMRLPGWFRHDLDPAGTPYLDQQERLWQLMAGVDERYDPAVHEVEQSWAGIDPVRRPGYLAARNPGAIAAAADHVIAAGMLLKHCRLRADDWALEYGAGFGQTALTLARLGVNVDTVDISATYCEFVRRQAEFFDVPLTPYQGDFSFNPKPGRRYRLIWFYESFHHCLDFARVVAALRQRVDEDGRVILCGEPIVDRENDAVPYPWGLRLHSEVAAVVRRHHWFELGFTEPFLLELFEARGFRGERVDCEPSPFGRLYVFTPV